MFEIELKNILTDDPLGLLDVKPKQSTAITADQRLVSSFEEINAFFREHNREPEKSTDINEWRLASRLAGLRDSAQRAAALKEYDQFNLLGDVKVAEPPADYEINSIEDILDNDSLGLLESSSSTSTDNPDCLLYTSDAADE